MIGHDEHVLVGRERLNCPGNKVYQCVAIGHVHLSGIGYELRVHPVQVVVLCDIETPSRGPVAIASITCLIPVHLGDNVHAIAGADPFGLIQVDIDGLL